MRSPTLRVDMAIRVGAAAIERILDAGDRLALQVQHPDDLGAAIGALKLARVDLLGLSSRREPAGDDADAEAGPRPTGQATVSPVVNAPGGPLVLVERLDAEFDALRTVPDVVIRRLEQAGVTTASVEVPLLGGDLDRLDATPQAVVLRLFPRPAATGTGIPPEWLDIACEWVGGDLRPNDELRLRILGVEFAVSVGDCSAVVHECGLARAWCDAVNGDLDDRIRTASLTFGRLPHLALAAGGPLVDLGALLARYELLQDVARELAAELAYACIDFEPTFEGLSFGLAGDGWQAAGGASPNLVVRELIEERVPDAYPYQVLGPAQMARLSSTELPAEPLGDGRAEVVIDDPRLWLPSAPERPEVQAEGWELLRPCLVTSEEAVALVELRAMAGGASPAPAPDAPSTFEEAPSSSTPDLDAIVLEASPHVRRGTRLTLLELVSWLAHEPHSDDPATAAPVLATFARWLANGLGDAERQSLKAVAARLVGTAPADPADEHARRWAATEWLVKVQAPAWLRAAGLGEAADRIERIGPLAEDHELVRAVDVLGTAIAVASRRIDITASIAQEEGGSSGALGLDDDPSIWMAWEQVAESTGWVAASEAATQGAPAELAYATDLRVIECSRDARLRDEIAAGRQSISDIAWSSALHAVADETWEQAWRAADLAARELSGFTIRIEVGRVAKTVLERDAAGDDLPDAALEVADRAARDSLTRAALRGGAGEEEHPWDAARNAARQSPGGTEWAFVMDEARRAVGEDAWAQAMADARDVTLGMLVTAPDTVARIVAASVAREASSAAARGIAVRAAAVAQARGARAEEVEEAVRRALEEVAAPLRAEAVDLLDRLIVPRPATMA